MTYPLPCPKCGCPGTDLRIAADFRTGRLTITCPGCRYTVTSVNDDRPMSPLEIWNEMVEGEAEMDKIRKEMRI